VPARGDLDAMMKAGTFREGLFYRLNVARISIPGRRGLLVPEEEDGHLGAAAPAQPRLAR